MLEVSDVSSLCAIRENVFAAFRQQIPCRDEDDDDDDGFALSAPEIRSMISIPLVSCCCMVLNTVAKSEKYSDVFSLCLITFLAEASIFSVLSRSDRQTFYLKWYR